MPESAAPPSPPSPEGGEPKAAAGKSLLGGPLGWIIVIAVVLLEAVFFIVLMQLRPEAGSQVGGEETKVPKQDLDTYNKYTISIGNLNYTVPVAIGQSASLSMKLTIVLGRTPEERLRNVVIKPEQWEKFMTAVKLMEDSIRDRLLEYISQQTYAQLQSPTGKEKIKEMVKEFINEELKKIDIKDADMDKLSRERVMTVLIPEFFLQQ